MIRRPLYLVLRFVRKGHRLGEAVPVRPTEAAMVVGNDGRAHLPSATANLAAEVLVSIDRGLGRNPPPRRQTRFLVP